MDKTNDQKKESKQIKKRTKKIKEKIMNKVEDMVKKEEKIDKKMTEKTPQKIDLEMTEKPVENEPIIEPEPAPEVGTDELVSVLKIPMQDAKVEDEKVDVNSALFEKKEDNDPEFESEDEDEDDESENLNDRYFEGGSKDDYDNEFFEDETLMAEMGVEIIDLGMQTLAMGIAKDFDNPEKYAVSEYKKKKIKKPLELLLRKRGAKVSPEVMFGVVLLVVYAPTLILAVQERKEKMKNAKKTKKDAADQIPDHIEEVRPVNSQPQNNNNTETIHPVIIPAEPIKRKGRPKGSKDTKKRSTDGYGKKK